VTEPVAAAPALAYAAGARYRLARGTAWPGPSAGRAGPLPLLLLHGLGGDRAQLWPYGGGDARRDRLSPDLRGHGATLVIGPDDCFTFAGLTGDLIALLDRLRFPAAVVAGMSMGAGVAARLAVRHPDRVAGLVLIRPAWLDRPEPNLAPIRRAGELLRRHGPSAGLTHFLASPEYQAVAAVSPAAAASVAGQFRAPHAAERAGRLIRMPQSVPLERLGDLDQVRVPSVVVAAPSDPQHPLFMARAWAAALPGGKLVEAPPRDADPDGYDAALARAVRDLVAAAEAGRGPGRGRV
jgi:pimeloyl-ACP methyl ester carboxylesterase